MHRTGVPGGGRPGPVAARGTDGTDWMDGMSDFTEMRPRRRGPRGGRQRGRGFGRPGGWQQAALPPVGDAAAWFGGRLPEAWFTGEPEVTADRDEIVVVGTLAPPEIPAGSDAEAVTAAALGRIGRFREETREERMQIADEAELRYHRKVAWGVRIGEERVMFTHAAVPVMTRLRQPERRVLDTLVDAGVARSRSEALAWCVKLVGEHTEQWLADLRDAMTAVDELRATGPTL
jgi:hypothetical protein